MIRARSARHILTVAALLAITPWVSVTWAGSLADGVPVTRASDIHADRVVIDKALHRLTLWSQGEIVRTYAVALGQGGLSPKRKQGDMRVPEGQFKISGRNLHSAFHRALRINYPRPQDISAARARGEDPGGDIMIHGLPNGQGALGSAHRQSDWTWGCIAVTNEEIEEIWKLVPNGTPVQINP